MRAAARATASSPSGHTMRVNPVGARANGTGWHRPNSSTEVSNADTSRSTRGTNSLWSNAAALRFMVSSSSAAPSM